MALTLYVVKHPSGVSLASSNLVFDEQGGSIGRGDNNNWVLPDPERFLSSCHCRFSFDNGQFYLLDNSTNGTYLNGAAEPIGKGVQTVLTHGDQIDLGDYQLSVDVSGQPNTAAPKAQPGLMAADQNDPFASNDPFAQPFNGGDAFSPASHSGADTDLFGSGGAASGPADDYFSAGSGLPMDSVFGEGTETGEQCSDPLAALDGAQSANSPQTDGFAHQPLADDWLQPESNANANTHSDPFIQSGVASSPVDDPLGLSTPPSVSSAPQNIDLPTASDHGDAMGQALNFPEPKKESLIPDDWDDDDLLGGDDLLAGATGGDVPAAGSRQMASDPLAPSQGSFGELPRSAAGIEAGPSGAPSAIIPEDDYWTSEESAPAQEATSDSFGAEFGLGNDLGPGVNSIEAAVDSTGLQEQSVTGQLDEQVSQFQPSAIDAPQRPVKAQAPAEAQRPVEQALSRTPEHISASVSAGASNALLDGLGLAERGLSREQSEDIHRVVGELMPVIVQGMMQVLSSRENIKSEFRMNVTTIQPVENNPLKFSVGVDEAIDNLFIKKSTAFKPPVEAFQESFDRIGEHQIAVVAGVRAAFKGVVERFNPANLEKQFERQYKGLTMPGMQKARYWSSYVDYYTNLVEEAGNSFQSLFGDEFVQAYEEQLRKLAAEKRGK